MYIPLKVTTDYSLLQSTIPVSSLLSFLVEKKIPSVALVDENLYGVMEFYDACLKNSIEPIVGLSITLQNNSLYLYAKNYNGYQNLLKLHTILSEREINFVDLEMYQIEPID